MRSSQFSQDSMVSALWKSCSEGDLESVHESLKEASVIDIEIKDHTGITPLIEAVKNGHLEVVRALLDKGADPTNSSSQGRPQQYTSDPAILELLNNSSSKMSNGMPPQQPAYTHDPSADPAKQYYGMPPQGAYGYYPPGPPMVEGAQGYYPPPTSAGDQQWPGGPGNLPPADVARYIPCRYFPACRYGASCMFLHPQGPYYQGSIPSPIQYPGPYDPMAQQGYPPNYYAMPPPSFQPPNGVPQHMNPMSPQVGPQHHSPIAHARSGSEIVSPVHFSPNTVPPPISYGAMSPVTPAYPHPGQAPVPLSIPPLPPLQQQGPPQVSQSPPAMYHNSQPGAPVPASPFVARQDASGQYPSQGMNGHAAFPEVNGGPKSPQLQPSTDGYGPGPGYRENVGHARRGSVRRGSFAGRKPPCLFFPSGRCKNGDECRFPHVIPDGPGPHHHTGHFGARGGGPRPRGGPPGGNAFRVIEEKFAAMAVQEQNAQANQKPAEGSSRSQSSEGTGRPRFPQGPKPNGVVHGAKVDKKPAVKQRVPKADEFPVLTGSTTPPSRSPGLNGLLANGHSGPTAAQVLQAPPPIHRDSSKESTAGSDSPESETKPVVETNGHPPEALQDVLVRKLPVSFATIATTTPDTGKEVAVSA